MFQQFERNVQGRDFVVGDIHGCFDLLSEALRAHRFDPQRDRCFAVGDLVDRGPYSDYALKWLNQPWFYSCLGNHEDMLLNCVEESDEHRLAWLVANGGEWWLDVSPHHQRVFLDAFERLPVAMEVHAAGGRVGIVHADVPRDMSWGHFVDFLARGDIDCRQEALWGRRRAKRLVKTPVPGIDRVVCGHTITVDRKVQIVGNVWFIDTGAFLGTADAGLTVMLLDDLFSSLYPDSFIA